MHVSTNIFQDRVLTRRAVWNEPITADADFPLLFHRQIFIWVIHSFYTCIDDPPTHFGKWLSISGNPRPRSQGRLSSRPLGTRLGNHLPFLDIHNNQFEIPAISRNSRPFCQEWRPFSEMPIHFQEWLSTSRWMVVKESFFGQIKCILKLALVITRNFHSSHAH